MLLDHGAVVNFLEEGENTSATSKSLAELSINPLNLAIENDYPKVQYIIMSKNNIVVML